MRSLIPLAILLLSPPTATAKAGDGPPKTARGALALVDGLRRPGRDDQRAERLLLDHRGEERPALHRHAKPTA